jgi:hypothetical protein
MKRRKPVDVVTMSTRERIKKPKYELEDLSYYDPRFQVRKFSKNEEKGRRRLKEKANMYIELAELYGDTLESQPGRIRR